jgi:hypothetical protein
MSNVLIILSEIYKLVTLQPFEKSILIIP